MMMYKMQGDKIPGIIGGMGPGASQLFYKMVTEMTKASSDQEHINMIILSHTAMPDRTAAILSGETEEIKSILIDNCQILKAAGADFCVATCNTVHYFIDLIEDEVDIPFLNMIKVTADRAAKLYPGGKIGVLSTDGTRQSGLYQKELIKRGLEPILLSEVNQKNIMSIIYDGYKDGGHIDFDSFKLVDRELRDKLCDSAILACTELSLLKEEYHLPDFYLDAMRITAEETILRCGKSLV